MKIEEEGSLLGSKEKPDWLHALESQSWQAELIASGLAILGSISLGSLIDDLAHYISVMFNDRVLNIMVFAFIYLYLAHAIIVVCFISHLILRILWAGFLGLSSVYPDGINIENESYSKSFLQKAKDDFPSLSDYSIELDNICSRLFSNFCAVAIFFLCFTFWILVFIVFSELIVYLFGPNLVKPIAFSFIGIMLFLNTLIYLWTAGPLKNTAIGKQYGYQLNTYFNKFIMIFAYKPISYIMWTQRTNQTAKQYFFAMLLLLGPISLFTGASVGNTILLFDSERYFELNATSYDARANNYLDQLADNIIIRPVIPSKTIHQDHMELFLPKLKREKVFRIKVCGEYQGGNDMEKLSDRKTWYEYEEKCSEQYYSLSIDDGLPLQQQFHYVRHTHNNEKGYSTYIDLKDLDKG